MSEAYEIRGFIIWIVALPFRIIGYFFMFLSVIVLLFISLGMEIEDKLNKHEKGMK